MFRHLTRNIISKSTAEAQVVSKLREYNDIDDRNTLLGLMDTTQLGLREDEAEDRQKRERRAQGFRRVCQGG